MNAELQSIGPSVPFVEEGSIPDIRGIRDEWENFYLRFIIAFNVVVAILVLVGFVMQPRNMIVMAMSLGVLAFFMWAVSNLTYWFLYGHSVRVGPQQYPHLHALVCSAAPRLGISEPAVLVLQGHGVVELFLAKRFTRRGVIILTSNLFDTLKDRPSSRELMMIVGRQLGHIMAGHYRFWFFKDLVGGFAIGVHAAWKRRCHMTADRIGLLVAGDVYAAEQGLLVLAVGDTLAAGTNLDALREQRDALFDSVWAWIHLLFDTYPYLIDRVVALREYAARVERTHVLAPARVGAIRLQHQMI